MLKDWNDLHLISDPFLGLEARVGLNGSVCLRLKEALVVIAVS